MSPAPRIGRQLYDWIEQKKLADRERAIQEGAAVDRSLREAEEPSSPVVEAESRRTPTSQDIGALIEQANVDHAEASLKAEENFKVRMTTLLQQRTAAELEESRTADVSIAPTLREALAAVKDSAVVASVVEAADAEHGDLAQQEHWRQEYGPAIATGRAVLRELRAFERIYGESLREVAAMRHEQLMTGLPRTGLAGEAAKRLVTTLAGTDKSHGTASQAVVLLEGTRRGIEDAIRSIERIIENPTHWSGGINGNGIRHQDTVRDLNEHRRDLLAPADVLATLNAMAGSVVGLLQSIAAMRAKWAGSPELEAEPVVLGPRGDAAGRLNDPAMPGGYVQTRAITVNPDEI